MKEQVKLLAALQEIDTRILAKRLLSDKIPLRTAEVDAPLRQAQADLDAIRGRQEQFLKKKRDREAQLADIQEKISKMKSRAGEIKTNKEYQAHLREIESMQQEITKIEDGILLIMEEMDTAAKLLKEKEKSVTAETGKLDVFKKELERESAEHLKELEGLKADRSSFAARIDPDAYSLYMSLLNSGNGLAVSRARNEICLGCNMNMPPQLFVELKKGEEIIQCPQCRRILFYSEEQ